MDDELLFRSAKFTGKTVDRKKRTATLAFASEEPVELDNCWEVLSHNKGDYDFSRLNNSGALLINHDVENHVGVIEAAQVQNDGTRRVSRAQVRFGTSQKAEDALNDAANGIRPHVSVGYRHTGIASREDDYKGSRKPLIRFQWAAHEISLASIPADTTVGLGRSQSQKPRIKIMEEEMTDRTRAVQLARYITKNYPELKPQIDSKEMEVFAGRMTFEEFRDAVMPIAQEATKAHERQNRYVADPSEIGLNQRDINGYSFVRAITSAMDNGGIPKNCPETDYHQQCLRTSKEGAKGFLVPMEVRLGMPRRQFLQRDLQVNVFGQGGAFVPTDVMPVIELLRNRMVCASLGATMLSGLSGNCAFPRQTAASTAQSLPEISALTTSNPIIDQIVLTPKRVGATCNYSKQLLIQSSVDVENFVRDDLMKVVAIDVDRLALNGQGGNSEPLGVMNTPGISSVVFGGTATWQQLVSFETQLGIYNADRGRLAWSASPLTRGRWKSLAKLLVGATTVAAVPLWEPGPSQPSDEAVYGIVNQYLAASTNQMPNNQCLFGNWCDLIIGMFGGLDIVVDPYTLAKSAEVVITINTFIDIAVRHAQSFCVSADAANQ